jgi:diacylglycerol O-acyltransferase / wax synthase
MGGEDAGFLELERPGQPMTSMYLVVLGHGGDRPTGERPAPITIGSLRRRLIERLDVLPALRWRLVQVPLRLHHPVLVDDPAFNLDAHMSRAELTAPGGPEELDALCGTLCAAPLDRSRPLWHLTLVDGLAANRQAIVWRFHHSLLDGAASLTTLARFFGSDHEISEIAPAPFAPAALPGRGRS